MSDSSVDRPPRQELQQRADIESTQRLADLVSVVKGGRASAVLEVMPAVERARAVSMIDHFVTYLGCDPAWLSDRLRQDPGRSKLLIEAIRTVADDEDFDEKVEMYARLVADGVGVDDQVDEARMVVAAVGQLKPPAIAALAELSRSHPNRIQVFEGQRPALSGISPRLASAALGQLEALGLIYTSHPSRLTADDRKPRQQQVRTIPEIGLTPWGEVIMAALRAGQP